MYILIICIYITFLKNGNLVTLVSKFSDTNCLRGNFNRSL
nr:MAG TPA_asm: hypothetical protein [Caudoviricetes sp.]